MFEELCVWVGRGGWEGIKHIPHFHVKLRGGRHAYSLCPCRYKECDGVLFAVTTCIRQFCACSTNIQGNIALRETGAALEGSTKLAIPPKILQSMMRGRNQSFFRKKFSNRSNLINKSIIICRGLVCPSVRVMVTVRLLREFSWASGRCGGYLEAGLWLNNWNKLSVYTTPCRLCVCMQRSRKKRKARGDFTV